MRTFALHRIIDIELRMTKFRMPNLSQWDPKSLYARAWGLYCGPPERVRVEVHPAFAEVVSERLWHESQQVGEPAEDGWLSMQFEVFTGGEFRTWLLGWGPWLRVVEPAHLERWITDLATTSPSENAPDEDEVFRIV
jgi:predicted DNA-binding transcriptional regulator YafY